MTTQHLDNATSGAILKPAQTSAFVEVRGASGKLLGYYNPHTHQWKYEDKRRVEIIDLSLYHTAKA